MNPYLFNIRINFEWEIPCVSDVAAAYWWSCHESRSLGAFVKSLHWTCTVRAIVCYANYWDERLDLWLWHFLASSEKYEHFKDNLSSTLKYIWKRGYWYKQSSSKDSQGFMVRNDIRVSAMHSYICSVWTSLSSLLLWRTFDFDFCV